MKQDVIIILWVFFVHASNQRPCKVTTYWNPGLCAQCFWNLTGNSNYWNKIAPYIQISGKSETKKHKFFNIWHLVLDKSWPWIKQTLHTIKDNFWLDNQITYFYIHEIKTFCYDIPNTTQGVMKASQEGQISRIENWPTNGSRSYWPFLASH